MEVPVLPFHELPLFLKILLLIFSVLVLFTTIKILRDTMNVLMEGQCTLSVDHLLLFFLGGA